MSGTATWKILISIATCRKQEGLEPDASICISHDLPGGRDKGDYRSDLPALHLLEVSSSADLLLVRELSKFSSTKHVAQNTTNLRPHTQEQTRYRRPTVKEHDHHWDSQQDFYIFKNFINFNKSNLTNLSTSVTHTWQHARNTCESFPLTCWSPSDDGHHWPSM
jgi:hypothetical protein